MLGAPSGLVSMGAGRELAAAAATAVLASGVWLMEIPKGVELDLGGDNSFRGAAAGGANDKIC